MITKAANELDRALLALWVGALWTVGLMVVPVLFAELDRSTAGTIAGVLFHRLNYAGLVIGTLLLLRNRLGAARAGMPALLLVLMLGSILVSEFALAPQIAALRETGLPAGSAEAARFGRLHGAAFVLYVINALFGLVLLLTWGRRVQPSAP
ncbi:MAG: DUF4149 domain-containing protein [Thiohalobacteraceae bacterium]